MLLARLLCTGCRKPVRAIAFVTEGGSVQLDRPRRARVPALAFALPHSPDSHPSTQPGPAQHPSRPRDHPITDRPVRRNPTGCKTALTFLCFFALRHSPDSHPSTQPGPAQHPFPPAGPPITDRPVRRNPTGCKTSYPSTIALGYWMGYIRFEGGVPYRQGNLIICSVPKNPPMKDRRMAPTGCHVPPRFGPD